MDKRYTFNYAHRIKTLSQIRKKQRKILELVLESNWLRFPKNPWIFSLARPANVSDPDSIRSVDPDPGGQKNDPFQLQFFVITILDPDPDQYSA
jgi:hypothetical protein